MNFIEFADKIRNIFHTWNSSVEDNTLKLSLPKIENKLFLFSEDQFDQLYAETSVNTSDNSLELYMNDCYYEVLLQYDSRWYGATDDNKEYNDNVSKIKYRHDSVSNNLTFAILLNNEIDELRSLFQRQIIFPIRINELFQNKENSLIEFISKYLLRRYSSIVIKSDTKFSLPKAKSHMYAYIYTYMFNKQTSLYPCFDIKSLFPQRRMLRGNRDFDYPKKIYNQELISYYNEAISSTILSHKYLSFYHILEYFYEKIFMGDQIIKAKEVITDAGFSYKSDTDIIRLIKKIQTSAIDKDTTVNEKTALKLLIKANIQHNTLKEKLIDRYGGDILEVFKKKVKFSDGNALIFSEDEKQYVENLANRIYKTRNAIVHSKESFTDGKKNNKYQPIKDDSELYSEIALIQVIAEIIISNTAKEI